MQLSDPAEHLYRLPEWRSAMHVPLHRYCRTFWSQAPGGGGTVVPNWVDCTREGEQYGRRFMGGLDLWNLPISTLHLPPVQLEVRCYFSVLQAAFVDAAQSEAQAHSLSARPKMPGM